MMIDSDFELSQSATFGLTDIGKRRSNNQDQFLIAELSKSMLVSASSLASIQTGRFFGGPQGQVLLVADGMGGHAAGEKASSLALEHLVRRLLNSVHWFFQSDTLSEQEFVEGLQKLLRDAHSRILAESEGDFRSLGMGTTVTMAYIHWPTMYVVHAGDSRCYLIRGHEAKQITTDHTLARQMVEAGGMRPEDEASSRWSNVLWNVLGGRGNRGLTAEVHRVDLQPDDTVMLCSDGLYRYFDDAEIAELLCCNKQDAPTLCRRFVDLANERGGEDNVTVIVSRPAGRPATSLGDEPYELDPTLVETLDAVDTITHQDDDTE